MIHKNTKKINDKLSDKIIDQSTRPTMKFKKKHQNKIKKQANNGPSMQVAIYTLAFA